MREKTIRREARLRAASQDAEPIDLDLLWETGEGLCGICREPLDPAIKFPDQMCMSVDHIVPLSKGGTHEQSNVQWAHLVCNKRKGARMPDRQPFALTQGAET